MFKPSIIALALTGIILFGSCKKETENQLINGIWNLEAVYLDTMTNNYLTTFYEYNSGNSCCFYKMEFNDDGTISAFYSAYDSLVTFNEGIWNLPDYNKIYMKVDVFIDGTFTITKPTLNHWELTSTANHLKFLDGTGSPYDTSYARLEMYKI